MSVEDLGSFNPASNLFGEESNNNDKKQRNIIRMILVKRTFCFFCKFVSFIAIGHDDNLLLHSNTYNGAVDESVLVFPTSCFDELLSVIVTLSLYSNKQTQTNNLKA